VFPYCILAQVLLYNKARPKLHPRQRVRGRPRAVAGRVHSQCNALFQDGEVPEQEESLITLQHSLHSVQFSRTAYDLTQEMSFNIKYVVYFLYSFRSKHFWLRQMSAELQWSNWGYSGVTEVTEGTEGGEWGWGWLLVRQRLSEVTEGGEWGLGWLLVRQRLSEVTPSVACRPRWE